MACTNCSKIRCKILGFVAGAKSKFVEKEFCGEAGAACELYFKNKGTTQSYGLGNDWDTLKQYTDFVFRVAVSRIRGQRMPYQNYWA